METKGSLTHKNEKMLRRIIFKLLKRRHFWRYADFAELAELYASRTLRSLALSMVTVFVAIFLYQNGYGVLFIALYLMASFLFRAVMVWPAALLVGRIGPKHATLISNLLYVPALTLLAVVPHAGVAALAGFSMLQGASIALNGLSTNVNFSKVKHSDHAGKELGYLFTLEKVAAGLSPVIGGLVAFAFGPQATILLAAFFFVIAATPLLFTPEPVRTHQHLSLRGLNWPAIRRGMVAHGAVGADFVASGVTWSLFIALAVFGIDSNAVYAQVGAVASLTLFVAIVAARVFGRLIDARRGGELLRYSVYSNILLHCFRPFVQTPQSVVATNVANETFTTGQNMAFVRGMFDMADNLPGYRIVYIALMELAAILGAAAFYLLLAVCVWVAGEENGLRLAYLLLAPLLLLIIRNGFALMRPAPWGATFKGSPGAAAPAILRDKE